MCWEFNEKFLPYLLWGLWFQNICFLWEYNLNCSLLTILLMPAVSFWLNKRHNCYALRSHNTFGLFQGDGIAESVIQTLYSNPVSESTFKIFPKTWKIQNTTQIFYYIHCLLFSNQRGSSFLFWILQISTSSPILMY